MKKKVSQASDNEKCTKSENSWEILITLKLKIKPFRYPLQSNEGDISSKPKFFPTQMKRNPQKTEKGKKMVQLIQSNLKLVMEIL